MEFTIHNQVLLLVFVIAMVMGAIVHKTNFCTLGAVSDWINIGDTGRLRAWILAIAVAMGGVVILEANGLLSLSPNTFPPYRTANFAWLRYLLGGFMFGVGMTLGSGCGNKTLIRVGGGNLKSLVVLIIAATGAYLMLWTDFFSVVFLSWMQVTTIDLASYGIASQELGALFGGMVGMEDATMLHLILGGLAALALLFLVFKSADFRGSFDNILGGMTVGLAVLAGWYITGGPMAVEWSEFAMFAEEPPSRVVVQSYTFISPMGDSARYVMNPTKISFINFGIMALTGVIAGSFVYAIVRRKFRIEWFVSKSDFINHVAGGVLMGIGGVLSMGCTIGQGVTGVSTLALGSIVAFGAFIFGSALTMKVQYYMLDERKFLGALRASLADFKLLPAVKAS